MLPGGDRGDLKNVIEQSRGPKSAISHQRKRGLMLFCVALLTPRLLDHIFQIEKDHAGYHVGLRAGCARAKELAHAGVLARRRTRLHISRAALRARGTSFLKANCIQYVIG